MKTHGLRRAHTRNWTESAVQNRYHSVEFSIFGMPSLRQFKIWDLDEGSQFILVKEDSEFHRRIKKGDVIDLKYYSDDPLYPTEYKPTEITQITRENTGRFRGHVMIGIRIMPDQPPT